MYFSFFSLHRAAVWLFNKVFTISRSLFLLIYYSLITFLSHKKNLHLVSEAGEKGAELVAAEQLLIKKRVSVIYSPPGSAPVMPAAPGGS